MPALKPMGRIIRSPRQKVPVAPQKWILVQQKPFDKVCYLKKNNNIRAHYQNYSNLDLFNVQKTSARHRILT